MFKDTPEGQTHSMNDGCGEPAHNPPLQEEQEKLQEEFLQVFDRPLQQWTGQAITDWWLEKLRTATEQARKEERLKVAEKVQDLSEALLDMYGQYCDRGHDFMSAGEGASAVLEKYGYADFDGVGRIVPPPDPLLAKLQER